MTRSLTVSGLSAAAIALAALSAPSAGQTRSGGVVSGAAQTAPLVIPKPPRVRTIR